ncbi:MAG: translocation/assembly module TamB domain-containing protein [Pusillimonas sp.]
MNALLRRIGRLALWVGPACVLLLAVVAGFVYWVAASQPGTRWAVETGVRLAGGSVQSVQGTVLDGLKVGALQVRTPAVNVDLDGLEVQIDWPALRDRRLHARNISAARLSLDVLETGPAVTDEAPFQWPALPVTLSLDRVALGELNVSLNNEPLLVKVNHLDVSLALMQNEAQLVFRRIAVGQDDIEADVAGEFRLMALADPWPFSLVIETTAKSATPDSLLCARHFLPDLPAPGASVGGVVSTADSGLAELDALSTFCAVDLKVQAQGSLDETGVMLSGSGQGLSLDAKAALAPRAAFPLRKADVSLALADGSSLDATLDWATQERRVDTLPPAPDVTVIQAPAAPLRHTLDQVEGRVSIKRLNPAWLAGSGLPEALVSASTTFSATLHDQTRLQEARLGVKVENGSRWNGQPLAASINLALRSATPVVAQDPGYRVDELRADVRLGDNLLTADGRLGWDNTRLQLLVKAARLADFWPGIEGAADLDARLQGAMAAHSLELQASYDMGSTGGATLGDAPVVLRTRLEGGYSVAPDGPQKAAWTGRIAGLDASHADVTLSARQPVPLQVQPGALAPDYVLDVGSTRLEILLPSRAGVLLDHGRTRFSPGRWSSLGDIDRLTLSKSVIDEITKMLVAANPSLDTDRGRVIVDIDDQNDDVEMSYALAWDFSFAGALSGNAQVRHLGGDLIVPGDPPFPLGLRTFLVDINARPAANGNGSGISRLGTDITVATDRMGQAQIQIETLLRATPAGGFSVSTDDPTTVQVDADINDLAWLGLFIGDDTEIGGALAANVQARSRPDGTWLTSGTVTGKNIRVVRIDDGVRLVDGTLRAHMEDDRFVIDSLSFPAVRRAVPKEWRTEEWTRANPDAQGGSLTLGGYWDISDMGGTVDIDLYRYPIMQRSDRFAMVSGQVKVAMPSGKIDVTGKLMADAGWVDLDMLGSVPTVDSDVVVIRGGQPPAAPAAPSDLGLNIEIDLGPRFYITGYGVDSGLVGQLRIIMAGGKLEGYGALRTRGGAVEAYGQRLRLRQGTITFQGDIASPVLNIEAVRTGVAVEAGVRVSGTARKPRIDLISYPDVSDVQKLSWLLLGRGPDDSGGDAALLFSVGSSFLGDGEPFYKKFGLDEVSMRSGELGSVGSVLPAESVVRGLDSGTSDIERKFIVAAKNLGAGFRVSLEQSLSGTGTVGRVSYRLARGLSAQLSAGTVSGLALIYRYVVRE